jgi:hypothetical protein
MTALETSPSICSRVLDVSLTGCASIPSFAVHAIARDAPVQILSLTPERNNLLAHIVVKNTNEPWKALSWHWLSQETLAGMIGTTRSRVNFFKTKIERK